MPRQSRLEFPNALHHVMARGIDGQSIFLDKKDLVHFSKRLGELFHQSSNQCFAWALMNNHFHLLIRSGDEPLSRLMRRLLTGHAIYFNRRHKRSGHLFQNRYKSILCQENLYFIQLLRYIHLNPIRAGEVKSIQSLNKYPFTGHATIMGERENGWQDVDYPLSWFGKSQKKALESYLSYIKEGKNEKNRTDLTGGGLLRTVGGWKKLKDLKKRKEKAIGDERILGDSDFVESVLKQSEESVSQPLESNCDVISLDQLVKKVCDTLDVNPIDVCSASKQRKVLQAKSMICYSAVRIYKYSGAEVANYLSINKSSVSRLVSRFQQHDVLEKLSNTASD